MVPTWSLVSILLLAGGPGWAAGPPPAPMGLVPVARPPLPEYLPAPARPGSAVDLQGYRRAISIEAAGPDRRRGLATLVDLNPAVGAWYLLELEWEGERPEGFHLQVARPGAVTLDLDPEFGRGLVVDEGGKRHRWPLWDGPGPGSLEAARASGAVYAPLCGGAVLLRNPVRGSRTAREWAADFLRDYVWKGEVLTTTLRDTLYQDAFRVGAVTRTAPTGPTGPTGPTTTSSSTAAPDPGPRPARLAPAAAGRRLLPRGFGLDVPRDPDGMIPAGAWLPVTDLPGIFASAVCPSQLATDGFDATPRPLPRPDPVEADALVYLVAFELARFDLGFVLGTEHPRVGWSERAPPDVGDRTLPGPDGIGRVDPLVRTGMLAPAEADRVVAVFAGGFKRDHGAFASSRLARTRNASHYGFAEQGVLLSRLIPGLSTVAVTTDGRIGLGVWPELGDEIMFRIRFARQNGVPLVEPGPDGRPRPGARVTLWGPGNWSGSVNKNLRTVRGGLALAEHRGVRYLVYAWFSDATPATMARVLIGYGCHDAMLLDMNAPEHTYLALHRRVGARVELQHLFDEMAESDRRDGDRILPRFVAFPDNRDFFYLLPRIGP